MAVMEAIQGGT